MILFDTLRTAIEERKRIAEAAPAGPWNVEPHYRPLQGCRCLSCYEDKPSGFEIVELSAPPGHGAFVVFEDESAVRHIATNDPASVIALCDHALEILERHTLIVVRDRHICRDEWAESDGWIEPWPCPELLTLAAAWRVEVPE